MFLVKNPEHRKRALILQEGERIIVGTRNKGLAIIVSLPEVLGIKCTRGKVQYKLGEVIVIVDMLKKVNNSNQPEGTVDYIRGNRELLQRTMLLGNIILPPLSLGLTRRDLLHCETLPTSERINGLDVYRLQTDQIKALQEQEKDMFPSLD